MAIRKTYLCPVCKYEAVISAGPSRTMMAAFNTFVCLDCNELRDLSIARIKGHSILIDFENKTPLPEPFPAPVREEITPQCSDCDSQNLKIWDNTEKPCPKCGGQMVIDEENGMIIHAD